MGHTMRLIPMIVATMLATSAAAQTKTPTIADLMAKIAALEARVATLESAAKVPPTSGAVGAIPDGEDRRVIRVLRIEPLPPDETLADQAATLEAEATKADKEAVKAMPTEEAKGRDKDKATKLAKSYTDEATAKRKQAAKLRREYAEKRHRITGWNGARFVILTTELDLSGPLTRTVSGDFIGWTGTRIRMGDRTDEYTVRSISAADKPLNFLDPPSSAQIPAAIASQPK